MEEDNRKIISPAILMTPELIEAQGKNDRELLTLRVKLLLEAKEKHPNSSFDDLSKLADLTGCGCGTCCCCNQLLPTGGEVINPGKRSIR
jgi:hypothetical protein